MILIETKKAYFLSNLMIISSLTVVSCLDLTPKLGQDNGIHNINTFDIGNDDTVLDVYCNVACPILDEYTALCNSKNHCEYLPSNFKKSILNKAWIWVPPGVFQMGSPEYEINSVLNEYPAHDVNIMDGFFISKYELTEVIYQSCEVDGVCRNIIQYGENRPQVGINWSDASIVCNWQGGELPTEAEWEYAASGPFHRVYPWGSDHANCDLAIMFDENNGCGQEQTWDVGSRPDGISYVGAMDMGGNAWEWTKDCWHNNYNGAPTNGNAWTDNCSEDTRVIRGGGFNSHDSHLRSSFRGYATPFYRSSSFGARCTLHFPEETCNGLDDDQDGEIDELNNVSCTIGRGECAQTGIKICPKWVDSDEKLEPICVDYNHQPLIPNLPRNCEELDRECGTWDDGCGNKVKCGECANGLNCNEGGYCVEITCHDVICPMLDNYIVSCNEQHHCEYIYDGLPFWRAHNIWIWIPPGKFRMGSPDNEADSDQNEHPAHEVTFIEGYFISKYELTEATYAACEIAGVCTNLNQDGNEQPQANISWNEAQTVCSWLGGQLPNEAEWEYAASGPIHRLYPWGSVAADCELAIMSNGTYGCGQNRTWDVGSKPKGASYVGAMDMAGNVWEWVEDCYHDNYNGAPVNGNAWTDECSGVNHMIRGGSFGNGAHYLRSTERYFRAPSTRTSSIGARCLLRLP